MPDSARVVCALKSVLFPLEVSPSPDLPSQSEVSYAWQHSSGDMTKIREGEMLLIPDVL